MEQGNLLQIEAELYILIRNQALLILFQFFQFLSLEMRRLRADLIEVFKIVKGIDNVDQCSFFQPSSETRTRDICLNSSYQAVDLMSENFHLVTELFLNGIVCHPKLSIR